MYDDITRIALYLGQGPTFTAIYTPAISSNFPEIITFYKKPSNSIEISGKIYSLLLKLRTKIRISLWVRQTVFITE